MRAHTRSTIDKLKAIVTKLEANDGNVLDRAYEVDVESDITSCIEDLEGYAETLETEVRDAETELEEAEDEEDEDEEDDIG